MSSESGTIILSAEEPSKFSRHDPMTQSMRQEVEDLEKEEAALKAKKEAAALKAQKREEVRLQREAEELAAATKAAEELAATKAAEELAAATKASEELAAAVKAQEEADAAALKAAAPAVIELAERANEVVAVVLAKEAAAAAAAAAEAEEDADETPDIPAQIASLQADLVRLNEGLTLCQGFSEAKRGTMTANFQGQIDEVVAKIAALQAPAPKAVDVETVAVSTDVVKADEATTAAVEAEPVVVTDVVKAVETPVAAKAAEPAKANNDLHAMISAFVADQHKALDIFASHLHAQLEGPEFGFGVVGADVITVDTSA